MRLSIVSTLYRSASTIDEFCKRCLVAAERITADIEIILVNDGSPDDSLERALNLFETDDRIVIVDLSRNFGHHKAMMTGLAHATGDLVFLIDSDLEEEPELLESFYDEMIRTRSEVIYGVQGARRGRLFERLTGAAFFSITNHFSDEPLPRNVVTARLMVKDYVSALVQHLDRDFAIAHLWLITGFRQSPLTIQKLSHSKTTYSKRHRIDLAIKHITTNSTKILRYVLYSGLFLSTCSFLLIFYYFLRYLVGGVGVDGFTSIIISILFFGGINTLILGILGTYVANILLEVKPRPYTIVRKVYRESLYSGETKRQTALLDTSKLGAG
ncbi:MULTISPECIES: glycosyltransferase family 2 protein [unclassified Aureimonas]|uniref:glycosyltransferase family 2 protein n=1 Tax=unclassified Aureimonas TaxID=2615206 RepID=UPI0006F3C1B0|nr:MULTISPECIES: glycosyltransferase family 2 protein [unclassified Aureimonas]KQT58708.1 glycosyl transferase [Aureimonas sp. Leaf427]KQT63956.1 glycosyl transferase [Aureimonas sp. Leaf460]